MKDKQIPWLLNHYPMLYLAAFLSSIFLSIINFLVNIHITLLTNNLHPPTRQVIYTGIVVCEFAHAEYLSNIYSKFLAHGSTIEGRYFMSRCCRLTGVGQN